MVYRRSRFSHLMPSLDQLIRARTSCPISMHYILQPTSVIQYFAMHFLPEQRIVNIPLL